MKPSWVAYELLHFCAVVYVHAKYSCGLHCMCANTFVLMCFARQYFMYGKVIADRVCVSVQLNKS